jgi:serine/threonine-protein kinase
MSAHPPGAVDATASAGEPAAPGVIPAGDEEAADVADAAGAAGAADAADAMDTAGAAAARAAGADAAPAGKPAGAAVAAVRVPSARPPRRSRRRTALTGAAVLLAVGLLTGYCATGERPDGAPHADETVSAPATVRQDGAQPTTSVPATGDAAAPGSPIQPGSAGGNPGSAGGADDPAAGATGAPGNPGGGTGRPTATAGPAPVERTFDTVGGSVTARCVGPTATLVGWDLLPGFTPSLIDRGPGPEVGLTLSAVVTTVRVVVRCDEGTPVLSLG